MLFDSIGPFQVALFSAALMFAWIFFASLFPERAAAMFASGCQSGVVTAADETQGLVKPLSRSFLLLTDAFKVTTLVGCFHIFNQLLFKGDPASYSEETLWISTVCFCFLLSFVAVFLTWTLTSNMAEKHQGKMTPENRDKFVTTRDICKMGFIVCAFAIENATSISFGTTVHGAWWYAVIVSLVSMTVVTSLEFFQEFFRKFFVRSLCFYKRGSTDAIFEESKVATANMIVFLFLTMLTWLLGFA
jgi:hypothetical protein